METPIILGILMVLIIAGAAAYVYMTDGAAIEEYVEKGPATVMLIGTPSSGVESALISKEATFGNIDYRMNYPMDMITGESFKDYNLVILQGDAYFDAVAREALREYVDMGGNLIVIEDAGLKHPDYPNVNDWHWPVGNGIPVPATVFGSEMGYTDIAYGADIMFPDPSHGIVAGLSDLSSNLESLSRIVKVSSDGDEIVIIRTNEGMWPAVIEGGSGLGKVIYFAYDPGKTPEILLATIKYMTGA